MAIETDSHQAGSTFESVNLEYEINLNGELRKKQLPFVIGVVADLSGKPTEPLAKFRDRRFINVTRDNFDKVLGCIQPRLAYRVENLLAPAQKGLLAIKLIFNTLNDFEPEKVATQIKPFSDLITIRNSLARLNGELTDELKEFLRQNLKPEQDLTDIQKESESLIQTGNDLVDSILSQFFGDRDVFEKTALKESLKVLCRYSEVGPIKIADILNSDTTAMIDALDEVLTRQMKKIMHAEPFRQLEAAWRGLEYLVNRAATSHSVTIRVLNTSKKDFLKELEKAAEFSSSTIYRKVCEAEFGTTGGHPFNLLVADYYFSNDPQDLAFLEKIAQVAAAAKVVFLSGVSPAMFNLASYADMRRQTDITRVFNSTPYTRWRSIRENPDSHYIGLALPRFLLRLPYGLASSPVETFKFKETEGDVHKDRFVWGNPAYVLAAQFIDRFHQYGWFVPLEESNKDSLVAGLPSHDFLSEDGERLVQCSIEVPLAERRVSELVRAGLIPLCYDDSTGGIKIIAVTSCHRQKRGAAKRTMLCTSLLDHTMAVSRIVHFLKALYQDKIKGKRSPRHCQADLQAWLSQYVKGDVPRHEKDGRRFILHQATVQIEEMAGYGSAFGIIVLIEPVNRSDCISKPLRLNFVIPVL